MYSQSAHAHHPRPATKGTAQAAMRARLLVRSVSGTTPAATEIFSERRVRLAMITIPSTPKSAAGAIA